MDFNRKLSLVFFAKARIHSSSDLRLLEDLVSYVDFYIPAYIEYWYKGAYQLAQRPWLRIPLRIRREMNIPWNEISRNCLANDFSKLGRLWTEYDTFERIADEYANWVELNEEYWNEYESMDADERIAVLFDAFVYLGDTPRVALRKAKDAVQSSEDTFQRFEYAGIKNRVIDILRDVYRAIPPRWGDFVADTRRRMQEVEGSD